MQLQKGQGVGNRKSESLSPFAVSVSMVAVDESNRSAYLRGYYPSGGLARCYKVKEEKEEGKKDSVERR
jgi:hypothetical protein